MALSSWFLPPPVVENNQHRQKCFHVGLQLRGVVSGRLLVPVGGMGLSSPSSPCPPSLSSPSADQRHQGPSRVTPANVNKYVMYKEQLKNCKRKYRWPTIKKSTQTRVVREITDVSYNPLSNKCFYEEPCTCTRSIFIPILYRTFILLKFRVYSRPAQSSVLKYTTSLIPFLI